MTQTSRRSTTQPERIQTKILSMAFAIATIGTLMCPGCGSDVGAIGGQAEAGTPESTAGESGQGGGASRPVVQATSSRPMAKAALNFPKVSNARTAAAIRASSATQSCA